MHNTSARARWNEWYLYAGVERRGSTNTHSMQGSLGSYGHYEAGEPLVYFTDIQHCHASVL